MFKSQIVQLFLTLLFGPLGLLYSSIAASIFWIIMAILLVPLTSIFGAILIWALSVITGIFTVSGYNGRMAALAGNASR